MTDPYGNELEISNHHNSEHDKNPKVETGGIKHTVRALYRIFLITSQNPYQMRKVRLRYRDIPGMFDKQLRAVPYEALFFIAF